MQTSAVGTDSSMVWHQSMRGSSLPLFVRFTRRMPCSRMKGMTLSCSSAVDLKKSSNLQGTPMPDMHEERWELWVYGKVGIYIFRSLASYSIPPTNLPNLPKLPELPKGQQRPSQWMLYLPSSVSCRYY